MQVKSLYIHPVKSCKGLRVTAAPVTRTGLLLDREWMIIKESNNNFISQRTHKKMCHIATSLPDAVFSPAAQQDLKTVATEPGMALKLSFEGKGDVSVPLAIPSGPEGASVPSGARLRSGKVWRWPGCVWDEGDEVARWLSEVLGEAVRLVRYVGDEGPMQPSDDSMGPTVRPVDEKFADGHEVKFADGFPVLLTSEASRKQVEEAAGVPLDMARFRPNIVVDGPALQPFQEDTWSKVAISSDSQATDAIQLSLVKPCSRCPVPDIDPATAVPTKVGEAEDGRPLFEPTRTLQAISSGEASGASVGQVLEAAGERGWMRKWFFGWNSVLLQTGYVQVGDTVEVLQSRG